MKLVLLLAVLFVSCQEEVKPVEVKPVVTDLTEIKPKPIEVEKKITGEEISLWATWYNVPTFKPTSNGIKVRDMKGNSLGVQLTNKDWCSLAMEGSGYINGKTYNYAGTTNSYKVKCKHKPSGKVKFKITKHPYGTGNRNNPLRPLVSVACDQKKFKYGQKFFIPRAKGTILDGNIHDGIFVCEDVGGLIKDNHIDIFIGGRTKSPFDFIGSSSRKTFKAILIK